MKNLFQKNPLYFVFFFPALVDGVVTIVGQSAGYWNSANRVVNEASPAYYFLAFSPLLFLLGSFFWYIGWYVIFLKLKNEFLKVWLALLFIAGHSWGSGSWIVKYFRDHGWWTAENMVRTNLAWIVLVSYFMLIGLIGTITLRYYIRKKS